MKRFVLAVGIVLFIVGALAFQGFLLQAGPPGSIRMYETTFPTADTPPDFYQQFTMSASGGTWTVDVHLWADAPINNVPFDGNLQCVGEPVLIITRGGDGLELTTEPKWYYVGISGTSLDAGDECTIRMGASAPDGFVHMDAFILWGHPPPGIGGDPPPGDDEPPTSPSTPSTEPRDSAQPPMAAPGADVNIWIGLALIAAAVIILFVGARR